MTTAVLVGLLSFSTAQSSGGDSIRTRSMLLSESALEVEARANPQGLREALSGALAESVRSPSATARQAQLELAQRLAAAYARAWRDSFLVREVNRFARWPPSHRAGKIWADSVRRAGVTVFGREGAANAIRVWRRAFARSSTIPDTAGMAAVLGNIGAAFGELGRADSADGYLQRAHLLAVKVGDLRVQANALTGLADVSASRGSLASARDRYARALELHQRIGDRRGEAADYNNLGLLAQDLGDHEEARRQYEAARAINQSDGRDAVAATNLINLAGLASLAGEFARAESLYQDALAIWRSHGMWADAADALRGLGQLEIRRGDYPAASRTLRDAIKAYGPNHADEAAIAARRELVGVLAAMGQLQLALDELRLTERIADSARSPPKVRGGIALARADLAVQLNALAEADRLYGQAELLYRQAADRSGAADAQHGRGMLLLARNDPALARTVLERALRTQQSTGKIRAAALVRLSLAEALVTQGDTARGRQQLARAAADLDRAGDPIATASALGDRGALEQRAGRAAQAASFYRAGIDRLGSRLAPEVAWRLRYGLGLARRAQGEMDGAATEFRAALAELDRPARSLLLPERRTGFLSDKWDVHVQLAVTEYARGRIGAAFEASERLRAREMLELLARGRVTPSAPAAGDLVEREQDLRRRIAELTEPLATVAAAGEMRRGPDVARIGTAAAQTLLREQEAYAELLLEIRERAPAHADLIALETATWRSVARRLRADEAMIEYLVSDTTSLAFTITSDTIAVLDLGVRRSELARTLEFARGTLEPRGQPLLDSLWRGPLRELHRRLFEPIEETGLLGGKTRLILVPHGELHYLPFAALLDDQGRGRFLVERFELTVTPSASVWLTLGERRRSAPTAEVLALAPKPDVLPASGREVSVIARLTGSGSKVLSGGAATEAAFRREAPFYRVLHLATYGILNRQNPLFSFVELAPGDSHDGRLEVHEVFGLRLTADLVVLSACQTGIGSGALADVPSGDDWVGLTRAFLNAGAAQVVATLWPVQDVTTAGLMEQFYLRLSAGVDPARALAEAQRVLLATPSTAHPFYWAGFVVAGGSEGGRDGR